MRVDKGGIGSAEFTFEDGATESSAVDIGSAVVAGLLMPAAFTGATLTFLVSNALDGTYVQAMDAAGSSAVSVACAASKAIPLPNALAMWRFVKLVGSAQDDPRTVLLVAKG